MQRIVSPDEKGRLSKDSRHLTHKNGADEFASAHISFRHNDEAPL